MAPEMLPMMLFQSKSGKAFMASLIPMHSAIIPHPSPCRVPTILPPPIPSVDFGLSGLTLQKGHSWGWRVGVRITHWDVLPSIDSHKT